jgi:hypothetical protein
VVVSGIRRHSQGPSCRATAAGIERGRDPAPNFSDQSVLFNTLSLILGEFSMLRFCFTVWGYARNLKGLITASVAAGALTALVIFAVSATVTIFDFGFDLVKIRIPVGQSVT